MNNALKINSQALTTTGMTRDEMITSDVKKILNTANSRTKSSNEKKRKNIGGNKMSKFLR